MSLLGSGTVDQDKASLRGRITDFEGLVLKLVIAISQVLSGMMFNESWSTHKNSKEETKTAMTMAYC